MEGPAKWMVEAGVGGAVLVSESAGDMNPGNQTSWKYSDGRQWFEARNIKVSCV